MTEVISSISFSSLRKWNGAMAILHFLQGIAMVILTFAFEEFRDFGFDIVTNYRTYTGGQPVNNEEILFTLEYGGLIAATFLLMSALAHFLIAVPFYKRYVRNLKQGFNPLRWFEYAFSSSVMVILIALLMGANDIFILVLILITNASMNFFGYAMELVNQNRTKVSWSSHIFGWISGTGPWIIIAAYFLAIEPRDAIPDWVPIIFIVTFFAFMSFAFNQILQYAKVGPWKDYLFGERFYQILSLVAKSFLAWFTFYGVVLSS